MQQSCSVLIVGAGPAGLAAAISLGRLGVRNVLVVEAGERFGTPDPVKTYSYRIDGHGFRWFDALGLGVELDAISAPNPNHLRLWYPNQRFKDMKSPMADKPGNRTRWVGREQLLEYAPENGR